MAHAQAFALDHVDTGGGDIKQQIDEMILQQIDLVDIEKAAMGLGKQAGLKGAFARNKRLFDIERTADPVFGGAKRQIHHRRAAS
jgi:hypothetical protein